MGYRDEALAKLDVRAFLSTQGVDVGKKVGTNEYRIRCPNPGHTDAEPSANVNLERGLWHCKACNASGGPIDLLMQRGASYKEALTEIGRLAGMEPPSSAKHTNGAAGTPSPAAPSSVTKSKLTEANVKAWHETGLRNVELQRWFHEHRGFTDETIAAYELGWDGTRVTIPVRDTAGKLVNVRRYMRNASSEQGKMLSLVAGAGPDVTTRLFPGDELPDEVLLVEGEWDAMICRQNGLRQA
jgi:DNA primase